MPFWPSYSFFNFVFPDGRHPGSWAMSMIRFRPEGFLLDLCIKSQTFKNNPPFDIVAINFSFRKCEWNCFSRAAINYHLCLDWGCNLCSGKWNYLLSCLFADVSLCSVDPAQCLDDPAPFNPSPPVGYECFPRFLQLQGSGLSDEDERVLLEHLGSAIRDSTRKTYTGYWVRYKMTWLVYMNIYQYFGKF